VKQGADAYSASPFGRAVVVVSRSRAMMVSALFHPNAVASSKGSVGYNRVSKKPVLLPVLPSSFQFFSAPIGRNQNLFNINYYFTPPLSKSIYKFLSLPTDSK
jgi:hypothetical protein